MPGMRETMPNALRRRAVPAWFSCLRLRYASEYRIWPRGRARIGAQKLRTRLGGSPNLREAFPTLPKHMQRRTYARLRELDIRLLNPTMEEFVERRSESSLKPPV